MGSIHMLAVSFRRSLSEDAGTRSGFALTEADLMAALGTGHQMGHKLEQRGLLRIHSEDYADAVGDVLFALGAADEPGMPTLGMRFMKMLNRDWREVFEIGELLELEAVANHYLRLKSNGRPGQEEIRGELRGRLRAKPDGAFDCLLEAMSIHLAHCPFFTREATDQVALQDLFASEKLPASDELFFDQRFINYLDRHPDKLPEIHWRQFEAMTAEWFQRQGYDVELGPGRNDEGVDIRLWRNETVPGVPPTVIVQCKREKDKVERVVVKALYADILHEKAESGLVVTTSDLSPGARRDCVARAYPITAANREEVRKWISAMRQPAAGAPLV